MTASRLSAAVLGSVVLGSASLCLFAVTAPANAQESGIPSLDIRPAPPVFEGDGLEDFSDETPAPEEAAPLDEKTKAAMESIGEVIAALDADAERSGNNWQLTIDERTLLVVTDPANGRMRIITPIAEVEGLPDAALMRLLQANFDTALDARYAVAQGLVWGTFIHPLPTLEQRDFASGLLQVKSLADTFGTSFSSGLLNYGGGDSAGIIEDRLRELLEELEAQQQNTI